VLNIKNNNLELVTIFIPVYNGEKFLEECIRSALNQNYDNYKIVVLYGGGTDDSLILIENIVDNRLSIVDTSSNPGMANNWNYAIISCKTKYFCLLHQDDTLEKNYLREMIQFYESDCIQGAMLYCDNNTIDNYSRKVTYWPDIIKRLLRTKKNNIEIGLNKILKYPMITCPTIVYNTNICKENGLFNINYKDALDWEYQIRAIFKGYTIYYLEKKLYNYRRHNSNESNVNKESLSRYIEIINEYSYLNENNFQELNSQGITLDNLINSVKLLLVKDAIIDLLSFRKDCFIKKLNYYRKI
jgi:glycosyltransferase involved in cell wall biosynthesis